MFGRNDNNKNNLREGLFYAHIGSSYSLQSFIQHYEMSCNTLYNQIQDEINIRDSLSIPLLYMMRHTLEIGLKGQIESLMKISNSKDYKKVLNYHNLSDLLECFKIHVDKVIKKFAIEDSVIVEFEGYFEALNKIIIIFNEVDQNSTTFRYPKDRVGEHQLKNNFVINLLELKNNFDRSMTLLWFTDSVFYDCIAQKEE